MTIVPPHRKPSRPVNHDDFERVRKLSFEMIDLMIQLVSTGVHEGIYALAHSQVDDQDPLAFFVMNPLFMGDRLATIINPVVKPVGSLKQMREGCVTFPRRVHVPILRAYKIKATFKDLGGYVYPDVPFSGKEAQVFQHEADHLMGRYVYPYGEAE